MAEMDSTPGAAAQDKSIKYYNFNEAGFLVSSILAAVGFNFGMWGPAIIMSFLGLRFLVMAAVIFADGLRRAK